MSPAYPGGMGAPGEPRFFVAHLQKTAGTTLRDRLRHHFPTQAIYPNADDGTDKRLSVISVRHLLARWEARGDEIRLLTGHFPLSVVELLDADFVTMSILREPRARTLSYLRHQKQINRADRDKSLEDIYDDPFRFHGLIRNHMTRMFSLRSDELDPGDGILTPMEDTPERLVAAKDAVSRLDVVGVHHRLESFFAELQTRFGLRLGRPVRSNATPPEPAPAALVERIERDNQLDMDLWAFTVDLLESRQ